MYNKQATLARAQAGFTLLEVLVALAVLLIGLVSVLSLFPQSLSLASTAHQKNIAADEATQVMGEISQIGADALYYNQIDPDRLTKFAEDEPVGVVTTTQRMGNSDSHLQRVTITVSFPNGSTQSFSTYVVNP